ncbi:MAG: hypothetical protein KAS32_17500, partial [Candidatus Peribacteraceae bacterium]|nr:hypothetical protein [Candidatus Peribacteraceae bacterium]
NLTAAFSSRYEKLIIGYSYKTNYIPYLCNIIKDKGGYAEVVSRLEYDLALRIGQDPKEIIFNGPVKHYADIETALDNQSIVNLDAWCEVGHVNEYARANPGKEIKVGIRININLSDRQGTSHIQAGLKVGRFGFSNKKEDIEKLFACLTENKNVTIHSLHGHTSSMDRSPWCYKVITETLCGIAARHLPDTIEYINIGGGMYGYIPPEFRWAETPTFDDYAQSITEVMNNNKWVKSKKPFLVIEPGTAMAANVLSFVTKIISVKSLRDKNFAIVDGSAFNTKPTFHKYNLPFELINKNRTDKEMTYDVAGSTCMEKDYLLNDITTARPHEGDFIRIGNAGAYTVVFTPPFINVAPAVVAEDNGGYKLIRNRQKAEDIFKDYLFED